MPDKFQKTSIDKIFLSLSTVFILAQITLVAINYSSLPEKIPIHYGISGEPDRFGPKYSLLILTVLSVLVFSLLFFLQSRRTGIKINWPIIDENKKDVQAFVAKWIRAILLNISLLFFYITLGTIMIALGLATELNMFVTLAWVLINLILVFGGIMKMQEINSGRDRKRK